jgi:hypothetical protein
MTRSARSHGPIPKVSIVLFDTARTGKAVATRSLRACRTEPHISQKAPARTTQVGDVPIGNMIILNNDATTYEDNNAAMNRVRFSLA